MLAILREHPEGLQAADVIAELARRLPPTPFEAADYPSSPGVQRYGKIVRFVTIPPVRAGWLVKKKGIWTVTPDGEQALDAYPDPLTLLREGVRRYRAWRKAQPDDDEPDDDVLGANEPPESATSTLEEAEERAWGEIQQYLSEINPYEFQDLVAALLGAMGYHVTYTSPPGPDQGLDIIAFTDPLGAEGPRIKVQVKRRADRISVDGVRSFMALLSQQDVGLFISIGGFTSEAEREVRSQEARRISLIDASKLFDLWVEHFEQIPDSERQLLPLKPVYFLAPRA